MARPSPALSTTTEVRMVWRTRAPNVFAPNTSAYLSIDRPAAIWYLEEAKGWVFFLLLSFFVPDFRSVLHCYCYKQHVQALEDDVAAVTHPNVTNKSHEKQSGGSEPREAPQGQLPPPLPPDLCEADTVSGGRTCRKTAAQVANRGVEIFEGGVAHWEGKKLPPLLHYRCWSSEKAAHAPTAPDVTGLENHLKPSKNAEANA